MKKTSQFYEVNKILKLILRICTLLKTHTHTRTHKFQRPISLMITNVKVLKKIFANRIHQYFFKKKSIASRSNMAYSKIIQSEKMYYYYLYFNI